MNNPIYLLPEITETTQKWNEHLALLDELNQLSRLPEYKGHDEEWEWKQLPFNTDNEYNYSEYMEYDSMNDIDYQIMINEQEFDRINKQLTPQDRIDMGIDTDLPF